MKFEELSDLVMQSVVEARHAIDNDCEHYAIEATYYVNMVRNFYTTYNNVVQRAENAESLKNFFVKKAKESIDNKKNEIKYLKFYDLPKRKKSTYFLLTGFAVTGIMLYNVSPVYTIAPMYICGHMLVRRLLQAINNRKARVVKQKLVEDKVLLKKLESVEPMLLSKVFYINKNKINEYIKL